MQQFNFKNHESPSLKWRWKFKDFKIKSVSYLGDDTVKVTFMPGYKIIYWVLNQFYKKGVPLSGYVSCRLAFNASIIGAGYVLKKEKKDGEVIVRNLQINYNAPIMYRNNSEISVVVKINILKETDAYHCFNSTFSLGENQEHSGTSKLFYCKPNAKNFSYLN